MDYNTENTIIEIAKRTRGRPKRETQLTDEEKKQRAREIAKRHREQNYEYRRLQQNVITNELNYLKIILKPNNAVN